MFHERICPIDMLDPGMVSAKTASSSPETLGRHSTKQASKQPYNDPFGIRSQAVRTPNNGHGSVASVHAGDPIIPSLPQNPKHTISFEESQRRLQTIIQAALKVLAKDQVVVIVMVPYTVHWVTHQHQHQLGDSADDVGNIIEALESMLGGPNSELVAEHIVRASTRAQLGIQNRNTIELRASARSYKADLDCYFDDPDLHAIVVLLTPMNDTIRSGYEDAQLSSMRYHIGFMNHSDSYDRPHRAASRSSASSVSSGSNGKPSELHKGADDQHGSRHNNNLSSEPRSLDCTRTCGNSPELRNHQNHMMHDFIPPMSYREVEYFYSLGTAQGLYSHHELELSRSDSIQEQEQQAIDPDHMDPHVRMRILQQNLVLPVLPREPRNFADVKQEIMGARLLALQRAAGTSNYKKTDTKCLECGTDSSPEWRKGPLGPKTLCNRCGLRYAKKLRMQK